MRKGLRQAMIVLGICMCLGGCEKANGLKGEIKIYLNAEQRAAYYTVDGQGSDDFKVDLTTLAE